MELAVPCRTVKVHDRDARLAPPVGFEVESVWQLSGPLALLLQVVVDEACRRREGTTPKELEVPFGTRHHRRSAPTLPSCPLPHNRACCPLWPTQGKRCSRGAVRMLHAWRAHGLEGWLASMHVRAPAQPSPRTPVAAVAAPTPQPSTLRRRRRCGGVHGIEHTLVEHAEVELEGCSVGVANHGRHLFVHLRMDAFPKDCETPCFCGLVESMKCTCLPINRRAAQVDRHRSRRSTRPRRGGRRTHACWSRQPPRLPTAHLAGVENHHAAVVDLSSLHLQGRSAAQRGQEGAGVILS